MLPSSQIPVIDLSVPEFVEQLPWERKDKAHPLCLDVRMTANSTHGSAVYFLRSMLENLCCWFPTEPWPRPTWWRWHLLAHLEKCRGWCLTLRGQPRDGKGLRPQPRAMALEVPGSQETVKALGFSKPWKLRLEVFLCFLYGWQNIHIKSWVWSSLVTHQVKDLMWSLLWLEFSSWLGNLSVPWVQTKKKSSPKTNKPKAKESDTTLVMSLPTMHH